MTERVMFNVVIFFDVTFVVDCTQAGEGDLRCEITHNGRNVPGSIHSEGHGIYRSSFMPDGHGIYTIRVYFAGMEVQGIRQC